MYRAQVENFEKVEERPRLKKPREEQEDADPKPAGVPVLLAPKGRPVRVNLGDAAAYFSNRGAQPLEIEHSERAGSFHFFIQLSKSDNTAVLSNGSQAPGRGKSAKTVPSPEQSPPSDELIAALTPVFQRLYHSVPDFGLLSDVWHALHGCPVAYYMRRVEAKLATGYKARPRLFVNLAEDAGESWRQLPPEAKRLWEPAPAEAAGMPVRRVGEPEDSGSIWSRIRAFIKKLLPPQVYSNWFAHTAQVRADKDTLLVEAQDQTTVDFLEQEYGAQIHQAIRELGLTVKHIHYTVPFENEKEHA
jgi:DnaA N-terminal domain